MIKVEKLENYLTETFALSADSTDFDFPISDVQSIAITIRFYSEFLVVLTLIERLFL